MSRWTGGSQHQPRAHGHPSGSQTTGRDREGLAASTQEHTVHKGPHLTSNAVRTGRSDYRHGRTQHNTKQHRHRDRAFLKSHQPIVWGAPTKTCGAWALGVRGGLGRVHRGHFSTGQDVQACVETGHLHAPCLFEAASASWLPVCPSPRSGTYMHRQAYGGTKGVSNAHHQPHSQTPHHEHPAPARHVIMHPTTHLSALLTLKFGLSTNAPTRPSSIAIGRVCSSNSFG